MVNSTTCSFCRKRPAIQNSHILPKLILTAIAKEIGNFGLREMSDPRLRVERTAVAPLLCTECEKSFHLYEERFARSCLRRYFKDDQIAIKHDAMLLAFALSVLWRVLVNTLGQAVPAELKSSLVQAAQAWRAYLQGDAAPLGEYKCYMFLDREFGADQIYSSRCLSHVDLRFTIEQGTALVRNLIGVPYRQIVYAKLGPFIFVGTVLDVFHGRIDALATPWREISPDAQGDNAANDGIQVPEEIVVLMDELASSWQFSKDDMKPGRREQLLAEFAALAPSATLKRLHQKDEHLFRKASGP